MFMSGRSVVIKANSIFGARNCWFWIIYSERLGKYSRGIIVVRVVCFYNGKKICVICWYSGWNFIVHGKVFTFVIKLKVNIISCVKFISFVIMITIIVIVVFDSKPNTQQM